jgi:Acyl-CoA dehydrogenase, middle domain.
LGIGLGGRRSRYDLSNVSTTARRQGDSYILSGTKAAVIAAPWADNVDRLGTYIG